MHQNTAMCLQFKNFFRVATRPEPPRWEGRPPLAGPALTQYGLWPRHKRPRRIVPAAKTYDACRVAPMASFTVIYTGLGCQSRVDPLSPRLRTAFQGALNTRTPGLPVPRNSRHKAVVGNIYAIAPQLAIACRENFNRLTLATTLRTQLMPSTNW
jgi:hypothetical protein